MILPMHGCRFQRSALPDEGMTMPALGGWHPIGWFRSDVSTKTEKVDDFVFRIYSRQRDQPLGWTRRSCCSTLDPTSALPSPDGDVTAQAAS
jgi:hypothetical protein